MAARTGVVVFLSPLVFSLVRQRIHAKNENRAGLQRRSYSSGNESIGNCRRFVGIADAHQFGQGMTNGRGSRLVRSLARMQL